MKEEYDGKIPKKEVEELMEMGKEELFALLGLQTYIRFDSGVKKEDYREIDPERFHRDKAKAEGILGRSISDEEWNEIEYMNRREAATYNMLKKGEITEEAAQELILEKEKVINLAKRYISKAKSKIILNYLSTSLLENLIPDLEYAKRKKVNIRIILSSKQKVPILRSMKKLGEIRRGSEEKPKHGGLLVDRKYYMNVFENGDEINAVVLYYRKCIFCLSAWLNRVWEESRKI